MTYREVWVVVDGMTDSEDTLHPDSDLLSEIVTGAEICAQTTGLPVEVYTLYHDHDDNGDECACAQYLTDHAPDYTFGSWPRRQS